MEADRALCVCACSNGAQAHCVNALKEMAKDLRFGDKVTAILEAAPWWKTYGRNLLWVVSAPTHNAPQSLHTVANEIVRCREGA
jgi:hypothetical protein